MIMNIKKQETKKPKFDELYKMLSDLKEFLNQDPDMKDKEWKENFNTILDFQDEDGSFKLFESFNIPSDARVDFCYMPTYICTAALMKAILKNPDSFTIKEKTALANGLKMSCARNLRGHGFEAFKGQIEALNIFMNAGLREFMDLYPELSPEFSEMMLEIINEFQDMEKTGKFTGSWGESYESQIKSINEYFRNRKVFVYGTLMRGESNHDFLKGSACLGPATINGYDMYDVGWYPAIVPGCNLIIGELYQVPEEDMASIDMLEGEGSLYLKKCETITLANGETTTGFAYIYNRDCTDLRKIPAWKKDYVWYTSYGSNMCEERFLCYIKGGSYEGSRKHPACEDSASPVAVRAIEIPYDMYFANTSGSWHGSGVSFLDTHRKGNALGVAYLITREQFEHVAAQENCNRKPSPGGAWYEDIITIGEMDGFEVKTITNNNLRPYNRPLSNYLNTLFEGIRQHWPDMSDEDIEDYLRNCIR